MEEAIERMKQFLKRIQEQKGKVQLSNDQKKKRQQTLENIQRLLSLDFSEKELYIEITKK